MDSIALIEELAANAVPAAINQELDGWRLRFNFGVTRRANSVLATREGRLPFSEHLAMAEAFYTRRHAPTRFQLCPASRPAGLDELLAARGYFLDGPPTNVQVAPLSAVTVSRRPARVAESFDDPWFLAYCASEGISDPVTIATRRSMLERVGPPTGFVAVEADGELAAVAFGVVERGWLGLFNVSTRPAFRRRGLGLAALTGLATWAADRGAHSCYLQVLSSNAPALAMYARLGFVTSYDYWYRMRVT